MKLKKVKENNTKRKKINPKEIKERRKNLVDSLTEDLEQKGVEFFRPSEHGGTLDIDSDYLALPKDITEIPSRELGRYLNAFTQQRMYMRTLIGWQEIEVEQAKRVYFDKAHSLYEELSKDKKLSETAKERIVNNTEGIKEYFIKYKDEKKKLTLLNYNLASIEDAIFTISREISRREGDFNIENRNENVQRR
ncbi:MAG: hypothetical protein H0Z24_05585 [Thermosipho sp. (in: Bacteria)]|nr:hypothetical protein [Thermosipho sp. (in: thermotogales)]